MAKYKTNILDGVESFFRNHIDDYKEGFLELLNSIREKTLLDPVWLKDTHGGLVLYHSRDTASNSPDFYRLKCLILEGGVVYEYKLHIQKIANYFLENIPLSILKKRHKSFYKCLVIGTTLESYSRESVAVDLSSETANFLIRNKMSGCANV